MLTSTPSSLVSILGGLEKRAEVKCYFSRRWEWPWSNYGVELLEVYNISVCIVIYFLSCVIMISVFIQQFLEKEEAHPIRTSLSHLRTIPISGEILILMEAEPWFSVRKFVSRHSSPIPLQLGNRYVTKVIPTSEFDSGAVVQRSRWGILQFSLERCQCL